MSRFFSLLLLTFLCSCTLSADPGNPTARFEPPIIDRQWQAEPYIADSSGKVCVVSAGHNAIEVVMKKLPDGTLQEVVHSTRHLSPGITFGIRVDGHSYYTSSDYFPYNVSRQLISDLQTGKAAYFEWYEQGGSSLHGGTSNIFHNMAKLAGFKAQYEECRQSLNN